MIEILYNIFIFPITQIIDLLFSIFNIALDNAIFAIFAVSFFINLICLPMYLQAEKMKDKELEIQEKMSSQIKSIKKNFKGDEKFMLLKTCYRQHKYHPIMSLRTSLSLLIQIFLVKEQYI